MSPQPAVVVAGDALVDLTSTTTARGTPAYEPHPGGSCLNVAVGLARLGVPTSLLARISEDPFGALLRRHLAASGVLDTHLISTSDVTALAVVHSEDGLPRYSFHSLGAADRGLRPDHLSQPPGGGQLPDGAALHVGSIALVQEPQARTLEALLHRESGRRLVSLDPNVRPSLVADRADYLRRLGRWVAGSDLVKVSTEDLEWVAPEQPAQEVAARWLSEGAALVLVTAGDRGAWAATRSAQAWMPAPRVRVVDTVGAGDSFTSAVLAFLHDTGRLSRAAVAGLGTGDLERLLEAAVTAAADTCTRAGAEPPFRDALGRAARSPGFTARDGAGSDVP